MNSLIKFENVKVKILDAKKYSGESFAVCNLDFLGTNPNSHGLKISEQVLKRDAPTILSKFVVAALDIFGSDATTHVDDEKIVGYFPENQSVVFKRNEDGYLRAIAQAVISKRYAKDFLKIFSSEDDTRSVSVEMKVMTEDDKGTNDVVKAMSIEAVTVLGRNVKPSSPTSNISFVRFAEEADEFYNNEVIMDMPKDVIDTNLEEVVEQETPIDAANETPIQDDDVKETKFEETAEAPEDESAMHEAELAEVEDETPVKEEVPNGPKVEEEEQIDDDNEHVSMEEKTENPEENVNCADSDVECSCKNAECADNTDECNCADSSEEKCACDEQKFSSVLAELAELKAFKESATEQISRLTSFMQKFSTDNINMSKKEPEKESHIRMGISNFRLDTNDDVWSRL